MQNDDPEIIYSELCGEYLVDGERLEVLIYRLETTPGWALEVVNQNGTSTVWDDPFLSDGMAWKAFTGTVENEGVVPFLDADAPGPTLH